MQSTIRGSSCGWGLIVGLLLLAGGSVRGAADGKGGEGIWKGREETRDGVVWVWNPDEPLRGERTVELTARWSVLQSPDVPEEDVASSDSMPLMGTLSDVVLASDGSIYALDSQLKCIHAFDPQGHYVRALSRPGQGPGELSQPGGLLAPAPDLLVLDGMPSRLVGLHADGTPAGNLVPGFGEASGALASLQRVERLADGYVVLGMVMNTGAQAPEARALLAILGPDGRERAAIIERRFPLAELSSGDGMLKVRDVFTAVWAAGERLYLAEDPQRYEIKSCNADGVPAMVIERECEPKELSAEEKQRSREMFAAMESRMGEMAAVMQKMLPTHSPCIAQIFPRSEGIWVLPGGQGSWTSGVTSNPPQPFVLDVFDARGRFVERVKLACPGFAPGDQPRVLGDLVVLLRGQTAAAVGASGLGGMMPEIMEGLPDEVGILVYEIPAWDGR